MNKTRLKAIEARIQGIKRELLKIGEMRPGSLTEQSRGGSGLYYQLSYTHRMKGHTEYVRPDIVSELRRQISTYKRFKMLVEQWVSLAIEHSKTKIQHARRKGAP